MTELPLTGGCNCGAVRFEVTKPLVAASYCHCKRCQRRSGAAASPSAHPAPGAFRIVAGKDKSCARVGADPRRRTTPPHRKSAQAELIHSLRFLPRTPRYAHRSRSITVMTTAHPAPIPREAAGSSRGQPPIPAEPRNESPARAANPRPTPPRPESSRPACQAGGRGFESCRSRL